MREYTAKIVENIPIAENIHSLTFELPEKPEVRAGQFAELSVIFCAALWRCVVRRERKLPSVSRLRAKEPNFCL